MEYIARINKADWKLGIDENKHFGLELCLSGHGVNKNYIFGQTAGIIFMQDMKVRATHDLVNKYVVLDSEYKYSRPYDETKGFVITLDWQDEDIKGYLFLFDKNNKPIDYETIVNVNSVLGAPFNRISFNTEMVDKKLISTVTSVINNEYWSEDGQYADYPEYYGEE